MSKQLNIGDSAVINRQFSAAEVLEYAELTTDRNPIHLDPEYAAGTSFGKPIAHGMLVSSLFSALIGQHLPGEGAIYLGQDIQFKAPVFLDQTITARVEITHIRSDKPIIELKTVCTDDTGSELVTGKAVCYVPWLDTD
jgi:acyl dehydratase